MRPALLPDFFDTIDLSREGAEKIARIISRVTDCKVLALYDLANDPIPDVDPDWEHYLLGNGFVVVFDGMIKS